METSLQRVFFAQYFKGIKNTSYINVYREDIYLHGTNSACKIEWKGTSIQFEEILFATCEQTIWCSHEQFCLLVIAGEKKMHNVIPGNIYL